MGLQAQLWRGIAAFRFASLAYAAVLLVVDRADYDRLVLARAVAAGGGRAGHPGTGEVDHALIVGGRAGARHARGYSSVTR